MLYSNTSSSDGSGFFTLNIVKLSNLACVYLTSGKKNIINHQKSSETIHKSSKTKKNRGLCFFQSPKIIPLCHGFTSSKLQAAFPLGQLRGPRGEEPQLGRHGEPAWIQFGFFVGKSSETMVFTMKKKCFSSKVSHPIL